MLLAIGDVTVDLYLALPRLPKPGEDLHAARMILRAGGSAANTAAVAAQLGLPARLIGAIGQDPLGEWVAEELRASGVEIELLQRCPEAPTSVITVLVTPEGERTMLSHRGASRLARLPEFPLPPAGFVHLSGYALLEESPLLHTAMAMLREAATAGLHCALDPGLPACRMAPQAVREALREVEILLLNEAEADLLFGLDPRSGFREAPRLRWIVLKRGEQGCRLLGRAGEEQTVPAFRVPVLDTTGAGDAFDAGFLLGLARGASPAAAALLGNAAGALACTVWGVIGSFPGREALERLLQEASQDPAWAPWRALLEEAQTCLAEAQIAGEG
ncbi:carbohydrate kinase family protein [Thermoflexus hugenholtzii]|uniref:Ribokinase n=1 Tax=Thermoflexus hugenholtzii JAD2 TaxID=877466 RepID=A0A212RIZ6_9CHLR|nr:carbohydrate kinase family protein [Thermoflexus hugenholtzii]SNB72391.1 ribokinase [Thermoflexus hugenholtzii JAD2]